MALIVAREVYGWTATQRKLRHAADLRAVIDAARILTERRFNRISQQIRAANVMEVAHLATTQAVEMNYPSVNARALRSASRSA
jgi:hypothetical protein